VPLVECPVMLSIKLGKGGKTDEITSTLNNKPNNQA